MTLGLLLLAVMALGLRAGAAALRTARAGMPLRFAGWLLAALAAWLAAAAAGAWAPLWPVLLAAAILTLLDQLRRPLILRMAGDALLVAGVGLLSVPMLAPTRIAVAALLLAGAGLALDLAVGRLPALLQRIARWGTAPALVGVGAFLALAVLPPGSGAQPNARTAIVSLNSGVMLRAIPGTQRITLDTGAVAWLDRPRGRGPFPGALFFHGNNAQASHQPAALAARRALLAAGFVVLAVDHPGYGESPHAPLEADVADWNPLPTDLAAHDFLRAVPGVSGITVVGHSMGNNDVLRLLVAGVPLDAAVMLGAAVPDPDPEPGYWEGRFLRDRGITGPMDVDKVRELRALYHDTGRYARELAPSHPPVYFVTFAIEWPNVAAQRGPLFDLLPGRKATLRMKGTHYLDSGNALYLVIGDTNTARELAALVKAPGSGTAPATMATEEARR